MDKIMTGPLDGIKVLDFTHVLAGPFSTRIMGDLGADVVKIMSEARHGPDGGTGSPYHVMWNRNKRILQLDMTQTEGKELARELCNQADIVIDNFSVGVLDRWGIGYDTIKKENPAVIYIQMSGMGDEGPWSSYVSFAPTVHALSGLTYLTGVPDREDIGIGFSYNDHQSGLHGTVAILAALNERLKSQKGQRIELSQFEVGVTLNAVALLDYFANGNTVSPSGNQLPFDSAQPHNCYPTAGEDSWVAIALQTDEQWNMLVKLMDSPEWALKSGLESVDGRIAQLEAIDSEISEWTKHQNGKELMEMLQEHGIPAGYVQNGNDLVNNDPELQASGFFFDYQETHPLLGKIRGDRLPLRFKRQNVSSYNRPEIFGESNHKVLKDWLGLSQSEVERLEHIGTVK
ncbi:MAG: hypothetical protein CL771_01625 [Chloroflexi bacterium]|nr:hypothetical protein [Chloroflexota bacterium]